MNKNHEGYNDPTPAEALKNISRKERARLTRIHDMLSIIKSVADICGFEIIGRVAFRDKTTNKEYR